MPRYLTQRTPTLAPGFVARDLNLILVNGQSLSIGVEGDPALTTTQPFANKMFDQGILAFSPSSLVDLIEGEVPAEETGWAAAANLITQLADDELGVTHNLLVAAHGGGGAPYASLKRGSENYEIGMAQVTAAVAAPGTVAGRAVFVVHGETDGANGSPTYAADQTEWQRDYDADVRAITGQSEPVVMFVTQTSSWTKMAAEATSLVAMDQLASAVASGGRIVMVGPKYHLEYADGIHLTNHGYRRMGEYYAKAYRRVILQGRAWEPVRPTSAIRTGAVIDVKFWVPVRPLVLDDVLVTDPGDYGFEYTDSGTPPAISSVEVIGPSTVRVTLASTPSGVNQRLRYAYTGTPTANAGPTTGPRGCLRDSDRTPSRHGYDLHNWCVHFDMAVTT